MTHRSIEFFEAQFRRQVAEGELALNPFEKLALEHLRGTVLDLGCGLGNLALAAARRGHPVTAIDGSATAIERIRTAAEREGLPIRAIQADLSGGASARSFDGSYDTAVSIGLLMFFARERALELLGELQRAVNPGGVAIVNALVRGTTYLAMFEPGNHCLFEADELERRFDGWAIVVARRDSFDAPEGTRKEFQTVVARKESP